MLVEQLYRPLPYRHCWKGFVIPLTRFRLNRSLLKILYTHCLLPLPLPPLFRLPVSSRLTLNILYRGNLRIIYYIIITIISVFSEVIQFEFDLYDKMRFTVCVK